MNPETIIAELRGINAWRRGGEEIEQPDPKHIGEVLDAAAESLRSLIASNTTLRRERDEARAEVAQLKGALALGQENCDAEYEALRRERDIARDGLRDSHIHAEQLEVRVRELEANLTNQKLEAAMKQLAALRAANAELKQSLATEAHESNAAILRLQQANAELAGALRDAREELYSLRVFVIDRNVTDETSDGIQDADAALAKADAALAHHAAGEPAKHPDTEIIDRFEEMCGSLEYCDADEVRNHWRAYGYSGSNEGVGRTMRDALRAAIDAARKEVQL